MPQIQTAQFESVASRALGVKGAGILNELDPALVATWSVDQPDLLWPQTIYQYRGSGYQAAVAAQYSYVALYNPTTSGRLVIVENIVADSAGGIGSSGVNPVPNFASNGFPRDLRQGNVAAQALLQNATNAGVFAYESGTIFQTVPNRSPYVIPPGWSIWVRTFALNVPLSVHFDWRERPFLPGEV